MVSWIDSWKEIMLPGTTLQPEHFYLDGDDPNRFSIKLIQKARKQVRTWQNQPKKGPRDISFSWKS
ncbi:MAG: hypothetical protein DRP08_01440 [Candidatus Aenigmatarchaeota archaeon]|nr:MAG: hypothetical protein DRP08_01440 [Candidatus Aenigmarchaeota archaeon]